MTTGLLWSDSQEIALDLIELYPDVDPFKLHFTDLRQWVLQLERFDDDPSSVKEGPLRLPEIGPVMLLASVQVRLPAL